MRGCEDESLYRQIAGYTGTVKLACILAICGLLISAARSQDSNTVQVDQSFNGHDVSLRMGQLLHVKLTENSGTGYE